MIPIAFGIKRPVKMAGAVSQDHEVLGAHRWQLANPLTFAHCAPVIWPGLGTCLFSGVVRCGGQVDMRVGWRL